MPSPHTFPIRIYFEDTDAGGVVYYANYLKFMERARTEMMRALDADHHAMIQNDHAMFVVKRCAVDYESPARLDDFLTVHTRIADVGGASLTVVQDVMRGELTLARAEIVLVCVDANGLQMGKPCRIPAAIRAKIGG